MGQLKLCVDCKYHMDFMHYCSKYVNNVCPVTGTAYYSSCGENRRRPDRCGIQAKDFEAIPRNKLLQIVYSIFKKD